MNNKTKKQLTNIVFKEFKLSMTDSEKDNNIKKIKLHVKTDLIELDYNADYNKKLEQMEWKRHDNHIIIICYYILQNELLDFIFEFIAREQEEERKTQEAYKEMEELNS
jgi:hypothetical protein